MQETYSYLNANLKVGKDKWYLNKHEDDKSKCIFIIPHDQLTCWGEELSHYEEICNGNSPIDPKARPKDEDISREGQIKEQRGHIIYYLSFEK